MIIFDNDQINCILGSNNPENNLMALQIQVLMGLVEEIKEHNEILNDINSSIHDMRTSMESLVNIKKDEVL